MSSDEVMAARAALAAEGRYAIDVARRAQRRPTRLRGAGAMEWEARPDPDAPSLSHLRGPEVARVLGWLWGLTAQDTVRYEGDALADRAAVVLRQAAEELGRATPPKSSERRVAATRRAFEEAVASIEEAQRAVKVARAAEQEAEAARFKRNRERGRAITTRADCIALLMDCADNAEVPYVDNLWLRVTTSVMAELAAKVRGAMMGTDVEEPLTQAADALANRNVGSAWMHLYDAAQKWPVREAVTA